MQTFRSDISFKELIDERITVEIPKIQRDYAYGREGEEEKRINFLGKLQACLDKDKLFSADLVYGYSLEDATDSTKKLKKFCPIDGQQRLTTLWLVYWYFSLRAGKEKFIKNQAYLSKFSYATREAAEMFCSEMSKWENFEAYVDDNGKMHKNEPVAKYIEDQTWFFKSWGIDPTISSMLRTISGTFAFDNKQKGTMQKDAEQNYIERKDCIEGVFGERCDFDELLDKLEEHVKFDVLEMDDKELPVEAADRLYVKMNARGKVLSPFENFKNGLEQYMQERDKEFRKDGLSWELFMEKIDTEWSDVFWKLSKAGNTSPEEGGGEIDDLFFLFINRYFLNVDIVRGGVKYKKKELFTGLAEVLNKDFDDNSLQYKRFEPYENSIDFDAMRNLDAVFAATLDLIEKEKMGIQNGTQKRIQKEIENYFLKRENFQYTDRLYFYVLCRALENYSFSEGVGFDNWWRVARNIIENAGLDRVETIISCMKQLGEMADKMCAEIKAHPSDEENNRVAIYRHLNSRSEQIEDFEKNELSRLEKQIHEEVFKAQQIIANPDTDWEEKIHEAEDTEPFYGQIWFMFVGNDADERIIKWSDFDIKSRGMKNYFSTGNQESERKAFMKDLAGKFSGYQDTMDKDIRFTNRADIFKEHILGNWNCYKEFDLLLRSGDTVSAEENVSPTYSEFVNHILDQILNLSAENGFWFRRPNEYMHLLRVSKRSGWTFFDDQQSKRNSLLFELEKDNKIEIKEFEEAPTLDGESFKVYGGEKYNVRFIISGRNKLYEWKENDEIIRIKKRPGKKIENASKYSNADTLLEAIKKM